MNDLTVKPQGSVTPGAQSIVQRATAALNDVHGHALEELSQLENKIANAKHAIELQSTKCQMEVSAYIELVDGVLRTAREISVVVDKITEAAQ